MTLSIWVDTSSCYSTRKSHEFSTLIAIFTSELETYEPVYYQCVHWHCNSSLKESDSNDCLGPWSSDFFPLRLFSKRSPTFYRWDVTDQYICPVELGRGKSRLSKNCPSSGQTGTQIREHTICYILIVCLFCGLKSQSTTIVMSRQSVNLITLSLGMLRPTPLVTSFRSMFYVYYQAMKHLHRNIILSIISTYFVLKINNNVPQ